MEGYLIIISVTFASITIAYKMSKNLKENKNVTPIIKVFNENGISFPVGVPGDISVNSSHDIKETIKVYFKIKEIKNVDIDLFSKISNITDWYSIIKSIVNKEPIIQQDYSSLGNINLLNEVFIVCNIESISITIKFGKDLKLTIINN